MKIVKLKNNKWGVDFRCPFHGRRRRYSPENSKKGAGAYAETLRQMMTNGEDPCMELQKISIKTKNVLFSTHVKEWFETYVIPTNKPSEQATKESVLRVHLLPWFGNTPIDEITFHQIEQFKAAKIKTGLNPKTINNILACLSKCLNSAIDWERLKTMPKIKKLPCVSKRIDFLSPLESCQLLQHKAEQMWHLMIFVGLRTGMRFGELLGLRWEDIDLEHSVITVRHSLVRGILGTPKNGKIRHLKIAGDLHEELLHRASKKGFVFQLSDGRNPTYHVAANALRRVCKASGIRRIAWHALRHTFASQLVMAGVALPVVKELLGHASIIMTMKYAHLAPSAMSDAVDLFEKIEQQELEKFGAKAALTPA